MRVILDVPWLDGLDPDEINSALAGMCGLHQATLIDSTTEEVGPPYGGMALKIGVELPCGSFDGEGYCGKPAAIAVIQSRLGGEFTILPRCRDCVVATARNYGMDGGG